MRRTQARESEDSTISNAEKVRVWRGRRGGWRWVGHAAGVVSDCVDVNARLASLLINLSRFLLAVDAHGVFIS